MGWGTRRPRVGEMWIVWNFLFEREEIGTIVAFPVILKNGWETAKVLTPTGLGHYAEGFFRRRLNT